MKSRLHTDQAVDAQRKNRRRFERHEIDLPVRFRSEMLDFQGRARFLEGEVADISRGGLFIRSDFFEMPGTPVRLLLAVPGSTGTLHLDGHVAWVVEEPPKGPGMGIRLDGQPLKKRLLDRFIQAPDPQ
jgi:uncharacterized protein (TIGR02266 family)